MIRLVRYLLVSAVVLLACTATASAEAPEFGRCVKQVAVEKVYHGKYGDAKCTKAVTQEEEAKKGKFEWEPGPGPSNKFTTIGGAVTLEEETKHPSENGKTMFCTSEQSSGEFVSGTSNKDLTTTILFKGCRSQGFKCTSNGQHEAGEVETNPLVGEVNWENKASRRTALALSAAPGYEGLIFFQTYCAFKLDVRGSVLTTMKNDKMVEANTLKYVVNGDNVQKPHVWHMGEASEEEVGLETSFERLPFVPAGLTLETTMTAEEPLELNAVL